MCVRNKTKNVNSNVFNIRIGINEPNIFKKHIPWNSKCKFDGKIYNLNRNWNNEKCRCESKNPIKHHVCKKDYVWSPSACACEID